MSLVVVEVVRSCRCIRRTYPDHAINVPRVGMRDPCPVHQDNEEVVRVTVAKVS